MTIATGVDLKDPEESPGAQMLRQAAEKTGEAVGDGTSTSTIPAHAIFADGTRNVVAGASGIDIKAGLDRGLRDAAEPLPLFSESEFVIEFMVRRRCAAPAAVKFPL